jgi:hypothetical protein
MAQYIGIKRIWYGDPFTAKVTGAGLAAWLETATEVKNAHGDTWGYTQDDPSVTEYKNELNGHVYYRDKTESGARTIKFTMGEYSYKNKADLQGGKMIDATGAEVTDEETAVGWVSDDSLTNINKGVVGQTKTGNYVVFTNASIVGKVDTQEKALGLGVSAVCMENETDGVGAEYWYNEGAVVASGG